MVRIQQSIETPLVACGIWAEHAANQSAARPEKSDRRRA
jgi:hypothetical protein